MQRININRNHARRITFLTPVKVVVIIVSQMQRFLKLTKKRIPSTSFPDLQQLPAKVSSTSLNFTLTPSCMKKQSQSEICYRHTNMTGYVLLHNHWIKFLASLHHVPNHSQLCGVLGGTYIAGNTFSYP